VKFAILPFAHGSLKSQQKLQNLNPHIEELKKKYHNNKEEQAKRTMALYKEHGISPFGSFFLLLIQLPVIFTLYFIVLHDTGLEKHALLYPFVSLPGHVNMTFLGLVDLSAKSIPMGLLVSLSQFFQMRVSLPPMPQKSDGATTMKDEFARSMNIQMRYVMPFFLFFIAMRLPAVVTLYWITSNLFAIAHSLFVKRQARLLEPKNP
jgi:YidC/Oxa1 family membrane protein insertase